MQSKRLLTDYYKFLFRMMDDSCVLVNAVILFYRKYIHIHTCMFVKRGNFIYTFYINIYIEESGRKVKHFFKEVRIPAARCFCVKSKCVSIDGTKHKLSMLLTFDSIHFPIAFFNSSQIVCLSPRVQPLPPLPPLFPLQPDSHSTQQLQL